MVTLEHNFFYTQSSTKTVFIIDFKQKSTYIYAYSYVELIIILKQYRVYKYQFCPSQ